MKARKAKQFSRQRQSQPGHERPMKPKPESKGREYRAANKLERKVAFTTGAIAALAGLSQLHSRGREPASRSMAE